MSFDYKLFGKRLLQLRKEANLTQKEVTTETGVSQETLRRVENGHKPPSLHTLERLSGLFKVDLIYLLSQSRTDVDVFSEELIKRVNRLIYDGDFDALKMCALEMITDLMSSYREDTDTILNPYLSYLGSVKDMELISIKYGENNIVNLKKLLQELSHARTGIINDPHYFPIEISITLMLSVVLRRANQLEEAVELLEKLLRKLESIEIPSPIEIDYIGTTYLNIAYLYHRQDQYEKVVEIIQQALRNPKCQFSLVLYNELLVRMATAMYRMDNEDYYGLLTTVYLTETKQRIQHFAKPLYKHYGIRHHLAPIDE